MAIRGTNGNLARLGFRLKRDESWLRESQLRGLRKFFNTNMKHRGVLEGQVECWMGHTPGRYNDVRSLGIEKQRNVYASASLRIRTQTRASSIDLIKEYIRSRGLDPQRILT